MNEGKNEFKPGDLVMVNSEGPMIGVIIDKEGFRLMTGVVIPPSYCGIRVFGNFVGTAQKRPDYPEPNDKEVIKYYFTNPESISLLKDMGLGLKTLMDLLLNSNFRLLFTPDVRDVRFEIMALYAYLEIGHHNLGWYGTKYFTLFEKLIPKNSVRKNNLPMCEGCGR